MTPAATQRETPYCARSACCSKASCASARYDPILLSSTPGHAVRIAESLRHAVAKLDFSWQTRQFELGVSVGVVNIANRRYTVAEVLSAADDSCYRAKAAGRNQIHVFDEQDGAVERRKGSVPRLVP